MWGCCRGRSDSYNVRDVEEERYGNKPKDSTEPIKPAAQQSQPQAPIPPQPAAAVPTPEKVASRWGSLKSSVISKSEPVPRMQDVVRKLLKVTDDIGVSACTASR